MENMVEQRQVKSSLWWIVSIRKVVTCCDSPPLSFSEDAHSKAPPLPLFFFFFRQRQELRTSLGINFVTCKRFLRRHSSRKEEKPSA
jgi:hypothetical protein